MAETQQSDGLGESSKDDLVLEATYFCKAQIDKKVDIVMNLKCSGEGKECKTPQRYVLVIDVSKSMDCKVVPDDSRRLLDRMKSFAELFIQHAPKQNWLSIVTFSSDAKVLFPMTQMTDEGKSSANEAVEALQTEGDTSLSSGLLKGLEVLKEESASLNQPTRDCIVLFTDGEANKGIVEANDLVDTYRKELKYPRKDSQKCHIQLATITIGNYRPELLCQVAKYLSTDAFYWLNHESEIEADMLLPTMLREEACLCDVNVTLCCAPGVTFMKDSLSLLEEMVQVERLESDNVEFDIGYIPHDAEKNISFSLDISKKPPENDVLFEVKRQNFDQKLEERSHADVVTLSKLSMKEAKQATKNTRKGNPEIESYLKSHSSFCVEKNEVRTSWKDAQLSYMSIQDEKMRCMAIKAVKQLNNLDKMKEVLESINNGLSIAELLVGDNSPIYAEKVKKISTYSTVVRQEATYANDYNWSRNASVVSSLCKEMPATGGVFGHGKQIFLTPRVGKLMKKFTKISQDNSKKFKKHKERLPPRKKKVKPDPKKTKSPYNDPVLTPAFKSENKRKALLKASRKPIF